MEKNRIGVLYGMPVYLGNRPGDPDHLAIPVSEEGVTMDATCLATTKITPQELHEFLMNNMATLAKLLRRRTIEQVGLCGPDQNGLIHIVSLE